MRKLLLMAISIVMFYGCEKIEPIPEMFTFTLNGDEMDFSDNIKISRNIVNNEIEIVGRKTNVGILTITLHEVNTGQFDESDYEENWSELTVNYSVSYEIGDDNYYYYPSNSNTYFSINVNKFDNSTRGELSGEFSAYLKGSILNSENSIDTILIETGKFSTMLEERIN